MLVAQRTAVRLGLGCAVLFAGFEAALPAAAQPSFTIPAGVPPEVRAKMEAARRSQSTPSGDDQKGKDSKEADKSDAKKKKEGGDSKDDEDKDDKPVKRPNEPPKPADPRELEAEPDANGRVTFSFHGQAWADVLQWLANVSSLSLDWRELPGDYLNLTTQRAYSLVEARDLINRHLQARGYTLQLSGEVLSVFKLDSLDPSLVPRITEEDLYDRQPHDVVKLSLATPPGLDPKQAVEDVKQALSPNAKVMPLAATKRLLMIDTVANLRMVSVLLNEERLAAEGRTVPREFVLQHVQAPAVIDMLYVVLGMDPNSRPSQMELRMQQQKLELMSQMAQRGKDVMKLMVKDGPKVYLVYNRQRNSVLANAPPEQMEVIARTIEALDVPTGGAATADTSDRALRQYRLKTIAPNAVITTLKEIGNLSPRAELRGDTDSKTIFARGTETDHEKVARLIEQLDGAETVVEVFWLRRLPAEAVAGSIESLIINKPKKKKKNNNLPWYYSFRQNSDDDDEPETLLRVDADVENNRLIVRGTPQQLDEVRDLLVKLGEPVGDRADNRRVRVLDTLGAEETAKLLEKLKASWPAVGGETELILPPEPDLPRVEDEGEEDPSEDSASKVTASHADAASPFRLLAAPVADAAAAEEERPPVTVQIGPAGQIVVSSDDTAALDRFEELAAELTPPPERYQVFRVRNRSPDVIVENLRIYFEEFLAPENEQVLDWWGRVRGVKSDEDEPVRLSRRKPLRFLSDDWSSTILVANATPAQSIEIGRLVDAWDRTPIDDRILIRRTATVKLRYAKASGVVSALKEVYRELLSKGDREFDTAEQKASGTLTRYLTTIRYGDGGRESTEPAFIGFDSLLSLGADDSANVVVVSAREEVYESVLEMVKALDEEARPQTTVRVRTIEGGVAMQQVRSALLRALATQESGQRAERSDDRSDEDRRRSRRGRR